MIRMGRRNFLTHGSKIMLLPLMESFAFDRAFAAEKSGAWVHMYFPMGCFGTDWTPPTGPALTIPAFLSPLKPIQSKLMWMGDVANNPGEGNGGHEMAAGPSIATYPQKRNGKYDKSYDTSADQLIATNFKSEYPNGAMVLSRPGFQAAADCCHAFEAGLNYISWQAQGKPSPKISDPVVAIKQFFGGDKVDSIAATLADNKSCLDYFTKEATALKAKISSQDSQRLEQYTEAVREYEKKVSNVQSNGGECRSDVKIQNDPNFFKHQNAMFDLMALAIQCSVSPAITYIMDFEFSFQSYGDVGVNDGFHNITHHTAGDTALIDMHRKINAHYASQFAKLVSKVDKLTDIQGGSILDDIIISMGSGMADSNAHTRAGNIPFIMAGGKNLGLPQNKLYSPKVEMSQLMQTIMTYVGMPAATVANYGLKTGSLNEAFKKLG